MTYQNDNEWNASPPGMPRGVILGVLSCIAIYTVLFGLPLFLIWMNG